MEGVEHPFADLIGFQVAERDNGQCETVLESDVFDDQERLLARAMGTFMILDSG